MAFSNPVEIVEQFNLIEGMTVADFGSGSGAYAKALAKRVGSKGKVYAIDVQKELIHRLRREAKSDNLHNLEIVWSDLERLGGSKLRDASVDFVLVANLLFQVASQYTLLLEAKRILKPGGHLAIIDWSDSFGGLGPPSAKVVSPNMAKEMAARAALKPVREFPAGDHHYGLLFAL